MNFRNIESVNSFYNSIAADYNSHMTESDRKVRESVQELFRQHVRVGNVLDFGGGTGLDLPWLHQPNYKVFFLEPSVNMRAIARKTVIDPSPVFIEENTDIYNWSIDNLPMTEKMQGVLANFAVLNCIKNIDIFFEKMAWVCGPSSYFVATVLDPRPFVVFKQHSIVSFFRVLGCGRLTFLNKHRGVYHETYIHSIKSIKKASHKYFEIKSCQYLDFSSFAVVILIRK